VHRLPCAVCDRAKDECLCAFEEQWKHRRRRFGAGVVTEGGDSKTLYMIPAKALLLG
jgi:hypothetical protein